jgi:transposase
MDSPELFRAALGLGNSWTIDKVDFIQADNELHLHLRYVMGSPLPACRECGSAGVHIHDMRDHTWRHLDFWQHKTYLHANVPRVRCAEGHVHVLDVPWARKGSGYTLLLEGMVLELAKGMPVAQVAEIVRLADKKCWRIIDWYVRRAVERQDLKKVRRIGLDETSRRRRHRYITIFMDLDERRVIFIAEGKGKATLAAFAAFLERHGGDPSTITDVSCDMSEAFLSGIARHLPNARVTLDRFHIVKLIGDGVDAVRRRERQEQPCLAGAKYSVLKRPDRLTLDEQRMLADLERRNLETARAYHLRLVFNDFFRQTTYQDARGFLKAWVAKATTSGIEEMARVGRTIRDHWRLIVTWTRTRITNGLLEGFNSLLQAMKSSARGYRSVEFITTIGYLIGLKPKEGFHHR